MIRSFVLGLIALILITASAPSRAAFHLWEIAEIYSSADGSVQYVELFTAQPGQSVLAGHALEATSDGVTVSFVIPSNTPSDTANRRLLFATPGFAALDGAVVPDYTLPAGFFDPAANAVSIDFAGVDVISFGAADLPVDGVRSLAGDLSTQLNSPTNFAAEQGLLSPPQLATGGFFWLLQYPALFDPPEACCADFDGDQMVDDQLGAIAALQSSFLGYGINAELAQGIQSGQYVNLIDWLLPPNLGSAGDVALRIYGGDWSGPDGFELRRAGLGEFLVDLDSPGGPPNLLSGTIASDGTVALSGDRLVLPVLFGPLGQLEVPLGRVSLSGQLADGELDCIGLCSADLVGADPTEIGGLAIGATLALDDYFGALDQGFRQCACAGIDAGQAVIEYGENTDNGTYGAVCNTENLGTPENCSDGCMSLTDLCTTIGLVPGFADFDANENGIDDSFTVGLRAAIAAADFTACIGAGCPSANDLIFANGFEDGAGGGSGNRPPTAEDQSFSVDENSPNTTQVGTVVAADPDPSPPENTLGFAIIGGSGATVFAIDGASGGLSVADQSQLDFETNSSFDLTVLISDAGQPRGAIAITVTVNVNDLDESPTAYADFFETDEDTALSDNVITSVTGGFADSDPDGGDTVTVVAVNGVAGNVGPEIVLGDGSTLQMAGDGSFTFTPGPTYQALALGASAQMTFEYTIEDGMGQSDTALVTIDILGLNDPPMFTATIVLQSAIVSTTYEYILPNGLVVDIDGDALTFTAELADGSPLPSWVTFTPGGVRFDGTPASGDRTLQFIRITATDPFMASADAVYPLAIVDEVVSGSSARDSLARTDNISQLSTGLEENDFHSMGDGGDIYHYRAGDGVDVVEDNGFVDTDWLFMEGHALSDATFSRFANDPDDLLVRFPNGDQLIVANTLESSSSDGIERLAFDGGDSVTMAEIRNIVLRAQETAGDDVIVGFNDAEILTGGAGDDAVTGDDGSDIYIFGPGSGADLIKDSGFVDDDRIQVQGYQSTDAVFRHIPGGGADLAIDFGGGDSIRVIGTLEGGSVDSIEGLDFSDLSLSMADLRARFIAESQTPGDDVIIGFGFADILEGGTGSDFLSGGDGSDEYLYSAGGGHDVIQELGFVDSDVLRISGYDQADAVFSRLQDTADLLIEFNAGDSVRIVNTLNGSSTDMLERVEFTDLGETLDMNQIRSILNSQAATLGDDRIVGFNAADALAGGLGNDVLLGGDGPDSYLYIAGDGADVIDDQGFGDSDLLTIAGHDDTDATLITTDAYPGLVILEFGVDQRITIPHALSGNSVIETLQFDNVVWDQAAFNTAVTTTGITYPLIAGTSGADTLMSTPADEVLRGLNGSDQYEFEPGDGRDIIDDGGGGVSDTLRLIGYSDGAAVFSREPGFESTDIRIDLGAGDRLVVTDAAIERFEFTGDGTVLSLADVRNRLLAQDRTVGDDYIVGFAGSEVLEGGQGNDHLVGRGGSDTYVYAAGDGFDRIVDNGTGNSDVLQISGYSATAAAVSVAPEAPQDLLLSFSSTDRILIVGTLVETFANHIEEIRFLDDGVTWTMADVRATLLAAATTAGDDVIKGYSTGDVVAGGPGNDFLIGGGGSDTYVYGIGDGADEINDNGNGGNDVLQISGYLPADASLSRATGDLSDLVIRFSATDVIRIVDTLDGNFTDAVETIEFLDDPMSTVWSMSDIRIQLLAQAATAGPERIEGFVEVDEIDGGGGSDLLIGRGGSDNYVFNAGDGALTIHESGGFEDDTLTINGYLSTEAVFKRLVPGADDILIELPGGDSVLLVNTWTGSKGVNTVEFVTFADDAVTYTMADIETMFLGP